MLIKKIDLSSFILLLFLVLLPFGQLLRLEVLFYHIPFAIHAIDLVILTCIPVVLLRGEKRHPLRKQIMFFCYLCSFSLLFATSTYSIEQVVYGGFYLLRFISYYFFFELVWSMVSVNKSRTYVVSLLIYSLLTSAFLGWLQYIFVPDLRYLKAFYWDDHLYRLAGTILDPGFMGILMVFGFLISFVNLIRKADVGSRACWFFASTGFLLTILFTYARASYLALIVGVVLAVYKKSAIFLSATVALVLLTGLIFLLPRTAGEGVRLERTNSIFEKFKNYNQTLEIVTDNPIFGVSFNMLCIERVRRFGDNPKSHACAGSDSSLLFVLATTGILGFMVFIKFVLQFRKYIGEGPYGKIFIACGASILVHSIFLNSMFYSLVMGVIAILAAVSFKENT
jgi:hypothetical protein